MRNGFRRSYEGLPETVPTCSRRSGTTTLSLHLLNVETRSIPCIARTELRTSTLPACAERI